MAVQLSPEIRKRFFDAAGDPLAGGKLYVYEAGTTTPVATYTDNTGNTANANPVILDSEGYADVWLDVGSYKFKLDDSGDNNQWTEDGIVIRDLGSELDSLSSEVTTLNASLESPLPPNRIISGKSSGNSSQALFLVPDGSTNEATLDATPTALVYAIEGTQYTQSTDIVATGLVTAPTTNNTCLVNEANLADQKSSKTLGEMGSHIPYDVAGSEITALDGKVAAFKVNNGSESEYFIARIDNGNSRLIDVKRGYFFSSASLPIPRIVISDNDTITLMKLTWLYVTTTGTMLTSYTSPVYGKDTPSSPLDGDMWFDTVNEKWLRYNSSSFNDADATLIGVCIQDENGNTVGARAFDFYKEVDTLNSFDLEYQSATVVRSRKPTNSIKVYGELLNLENAYQEWDITADLETDVTESSSTDYYAYITESGEKILSDIAPYDRIGDLKGYYHPYETWRFVGKVTNNSSSDFEASTVSNSLEKMTDIQIASKSVNSAYSIRPDDGIVNVDASGGALSLTLFPPVLARNRIVRIRKSDSSLNQVTISDGTLSTKVSTEGEIVTLFSDGSSWFVLNRHIPDYSDEFTLTIGATTTAPTKGVIAYDSCWISRIGGFGKLSYNFRQSSSSGANSGSGNYLVTLPAGIAFDSARDFTPDGGYVSPTVGGGRIHTTGSGEHTCSIAMYSTTQFQIVRDKSSFDGSIWGSAGAAMASEAVIQISVTSNLIPIVGWEG